MQIMLITVRVMQWLAIRLKMPQRVRLPTAHPVAGPPGSAWQTRRHALASESEEMLHFEVSSAARPRRPGAGSFEWQIMAPR